MQKNENTNLAAFMSDRPLDNFTNISDLVSRVTGLPADPAVIRAEGVTLEVLRLPPTDFFTVIEHITVKRRGRDKAILRRTVKETWSDDHSLTMEVEVGIVRIFPEGGE